MAKSDELKSLLENVPGSYSDFVNAIMEDAEEYDAYDKFISFIKENPDATSSDICFFEADEIFHLEVEYDEDE